MDSLKNARLKAASTEPVLTFIKSGLNKKCNPLAAPGRVILLPQIIRSSKNKTGMSFFETDSIPCVTPMISTAPMHIITTSCQANTWKGLLVRL